MGIDEWEIIEGIHSNCLSVKNGSIDKYEFFRRIEKLMNKKQNGTEVSQETV